MLMNLAHHLSEGQPTLSDRQRAVLLMGAGGSVKLPALDRLRGIPFARATARSAVAVLNATATIGPMAVAQQVLTPASSRTELTAAGIIDPLNPDNDEPAITTPQQRNDQRRAGLIGSSSAVAAGVLLQRAINHGGRADTPLGGVARTLGNQLAVGGAAGMIVLATEQVLGRSGRRAVSDPRTGLLIGGLIATTQTKMLRRASSVLTLPASPYATTKPK